jgi:hypothetical protein
MPYGEVKPITLEFVANNSAPNVSSMTVKCLITWTTPGNDSDPHQDHTELDAKREYIIHEMRDQGRTDGVPVFVSLNTTARNFIDTSAAEEFAGTIIRLCSEFNLPLPTWTIEPISSGS